MSKKRILVCEYHQESNTFNPIVSPLEKFSAALGYEGEKIYRYTLIGNQIHFHLPEMYDCDDDDLVPDEFYTIKL